MRLSRISFSSNRICGSFVLIFRDEKSGQARPQVQSLDARLGNVLTAVECVVDLTMYLDFGSSSQRFCSQEMNSGTAESVRYLVVGACHKKKLSQHIDYIQTPTTFA